MKILFLDIDGVLNSYNSGGYLTIKKSKIRFIRELIEATDCKIVLSSTWRRRSDWLKVAKRKLGYKGVEIYDCTTSEYFKEKQIRGDEIQRYLDEHPEVTNYAIVDDNYDMLPSHIENFVLTDPNIGVTELDIEKLIEILNG